MLQEIVSAYLVFLLWDVLAKKYTFVVKPYEVFETAKSHLLYFYPKSQSIPTAPQSIPTAIPAPQPIPTRTEEPPEIIIEHNDDACIIAIFLWFISIMCLSNTRNRRSHHRRHLRRNSPRINS